MHYCQILIYCRRVIITKCPYNFGDYTIVLQKKEESTLDKFKVQEEEEEILKFATYN